MNAICQEPPEDFLVNGDIGTHFFTNRRFVNESPAGIARSVFCLFPSAKVSRTEAVRCGP